MIINKMLDQAAHIIDRIHHHPFNQELAAGTLPKEKFIYYLSQDALYLNDFSRALALTSARVEHIHQARILMQFSSKAIQAENDLHSQYLSSPTTHEKNPSCFNYTNFLLNMATNAPVEVAMASLLPCFWVYQEVGKTIAAFSSAHSNPYQSWIDLYSSTAFEESVQSAIEITNELGHNASQKAQEKMISAFVKSTQLEWMFWESAYQLEAWPIA